MCRRSTVLLTAVVSLLCAGPLPAAPRKLPIPDHVIIVMEENHGYSEIIGNKSAPYINSLAAAGALFTKSYAITHPSQPNYLELFSGSNQGVTDDSCPHTFKTKNEESELLALGFTFKGYSEGLPNRGSELCTSGEYARKHVPWTNFTNDPGKYSVPFSKFPTDYGRLPKVSWVIPNLLHDMHDGSIARGDSWLKNNLADYIAWAQSNNSLLIVTWDEDDGNEGNHIVTIFVGPMVAPGQYSEKINHYNVLRTIEAIYGLKPLGNSASVKPIKDVWQ